MAITWTEYHYDTVEDLFQASTTGLRFAGNARLTDYYCGRAWLCADRPRLETVAAGMAALRAGTFPKGVERLQALSAKIEAPAPMSIRRRLTRGDHGDELDMGRVWQGDLDNAWSRAARQSSPAVSRVAIGVAVSASAYVDPLKMAWRGVAACALADALEAAGYTTELSALSWDLYYGLAQEGQKLSVTVKPAGQPLDVHKVASLLTTALMYRACIIQHATRHAPGQISDGHTLPQPNLVEPPSGVGFDYACLVPQEVENQQAATAWVKNQVEAIERKQRGE